MSRTLVINALAIVVAAAGTILVVARAMADTPQAIQIALPADVTVVPNQTEAIFIGRPTSGDSVICAPGTAQVQSVNLVDHAGGEPARVSRAIAYHDHAIPSGTRYLIVSGATACSTDLRLYTAMLQ